MKNLLITLFISAGIIILQSCGEDDSNSGSVKDISGCVQKGPFINGSSLTVYDLNPDLSQSGKTYNAQITDDLGSFTTGNVMLNSNYVKLKADGYYYNEVTGKQSVSQLTLYALSDISDKSKINVNILTHLEQSRIEFLMKQGKSFSAAKTQAQKEVLSIFKIDKNNIKYSESLTISEKGEDNGILLAVSSIIQGYRSESELTELLSNISSDIKEDGIINNTEFGSALVNHAIYLDTTAIKNNLVKLYNQEATEIPLFGKHILNFISQTEFPVTESLIGYPQTGIFGENILSLTKTQYGAGRENLYSLAAVIPENMSLKIKITSLTQSRWAYSMGTGTNWTITNFDVENYSQTFTSIESGKPCDLKLYFYAGSYLVEYFEMGSEKATRSKTIIAE